MQVIGRVLENKAGARSVASASRSRMWRRYDTETRIHNIRKWA